MLVKDEYIGFMIEYADNKMFATGYPTCMFLIDEWNKIRCIQDPNLSNSEKDFCFMLPNFDVDNFPFIAVCGLANLSLFNVRDKTFSTLIDQNMETDCAG